MRIGVLAERAGLKSSQIRFYEKRGLLPEPVRLTSGYRDYDERAVDLLRFIKQARDLGFPLAEIAAHLASPYDRYRKQRLLTRVAHRIEQLDAEAERIAEQRRSLTHIVEQLNRADYGTERR